MIKRHASSVRHRSWCYVICVLCSLLLSIFLAGCNPPGASVVPTFAPPPPYSPPPGSAYTVEPGNLLEIIETRGRVVARREAPLMFPVGGTLKAVYVSPSDAVKEGDLLAELDAPEVERQAMLAQFDLALAEASLRTAELNAREAAQMTAPPGLMVDVELLSVQIAAERAQAARDRANQEYLRALDRIWELPEVAEAYAWELHLKQQDLDLAQAHLTHVRQTRQQVQLQSQQSLSMTLALHELQVEMARIRVERARLEYTLITEQLSGTLLTAPLPGVIVSIEKQAGDNVGAYEPIGTVADPSELWIVATVLEEEVDRVAIGQPVTIQLDIYPNKEYVGTILQVINRPTVLQGRNTYEVTITFDADQNVPAIVRVGADVQIAGRTREDVLVVPSNAIHTVGKQAYVEVVKDDGDFERIDIQTGVSDGTLTEIVAGIQVGQVVRMP